MLKNKTLVAVYGTLREGQGNWSNILEGVANKLSTEKVYGYKMYNTGYFPAAVEDTDKSIVVELYEVDDNTLRRLDNLEGYSKGNEEHNMYNKDTVETSMGPASLYVWNSSINSMEEITSGDWFNK